VNRTILPFAALSIFVLACAPALSQSAGLPQTSMGRVGVPGDNQYTNSTQRTRHAPPPAPVAVAKVAPPIYGSEWHPTPRPFHADPSIAPIAADEPIPATGFPPLPDRLELPVSVGWAPGGGSGGGGGHGSGGGSGGPPQPVGMHQHYGHYDAGAFMQQQHKSGYYKCTTPEQFNVNPAGGGGAAGAKADGGGSGPSPEQVAAARGLRALGQEPKLDGEADNAASTAPPQAVSINQATTQDLSLPEDDFQRKATPMQSTSAPSTVGRITRRIGQQVMYRAYSTGLGAAGSLHF